MTTMTIHSSTGITARAGWGSSKLLGQLLRSISRQITLRKDRQTLSDMPDYLLRDIGISRWEIDAATRFGRSRATER